MTSFNRTTTPSSSHNSASSQTPFQHRPFSDPNRLAPEDAYTAQSHLRQQRENSSHGRSTDVIVDAGHQNARLGQTGGRRTEKDRGRSGSRRRKSEWKKLLWVKQSYPDNYTDPPTFLSRLQRNPRLLPYDFWPLVADSTVIVQHISSVAIFVCCFVGIIQERISPVSVVGWGSVVTVLGYMLWDFWVGQQEAAKVPIETLPIGNGNATVGDAASGASSSLSIKDFQGQGLGLTLTTANLSKGHSQSQGQNNIPPASSASSPTLSLHANNTPVSSNYHMQSTFCPPTSIVSARNQQRLATAKSAILIYCALLGLSPILKSLTKSTTSDSIWAMSSWLMCINIFFFDYGGGVGVKFPASLSTNAALMASTVLASRLPSTTHVFSLTLFSIEVFGLFPVFRRHLRHISWRGHLVLTLALVVGAGAGMGVALAGKGRGGWKAVMGGVSLWGVGTAVGMGGCSWWLIGLQKYKNVVIGPWDPARPIIRQGEGWE